MRLANIENVKMHPWFKGIDWETISRKKCPKVPYVPDEVNKISDSSVNKLEVRQRV
jgi:hypothetical protein